MSAALGFAEKIVRLSSAFAEAGLQHAFGGALALAYYAEPRVTIDIDVNVFVTPERAADVVAVLLDLGIAIDDTQSFVDEIRERGHIRVPWERTPVDLFFAYDAFHESAAARCRVVPFGEDSIPILSAEDLMVCKVLFDRRKDWLDIEQMLLTTAGALDIAYVTQWLERTMPDGDHRLERLATTVAEILGNGAG